MSFSRYSWASSSWACGIGISLQPARSEESCLKAFMSTRSITPSRSCSAPIGISVATTWGPKEALSCSSARKKSARSRSSMFTNSMRAMSSSAARAHSRVAVTSTPITALITNTADSQTRSAPSASATKLGSPGVSIRLILRSCHSKEFSAAEIDICRACSSGSASETVLPSGTEPSRVVAPASNNRASCSAVFPDPRWPTRTTLRMRSAGGRSPAGRIMPPSWLSVRAPYRCHARSARGSMPRLGQSSKDSSCIRERRRRTALVCICDTRDSVTPSTSPISRSVRFS